MAVSVDPRGDTPANVARFLKEHQLTGQMQYLIGSAAELAPVWQKWGVGSARDAGNPEFINHSALVYGVSASGKLTDRLPGEPEPLGNRPRRPAAAGELSLRIGSCAQ